MRSIAVLLVLIHCLSCIANTDSTPTQKSIKILVLDTEGYPSYYYRTLIMLAKSTGFTVDYQRFFEFLENDTLPNYDGIFFIPGLSFFRNITSDIGKKTIQQLQKFSQRGNRTIGILLPGMSRFSHPLVTVSTELLNAVGVFDLPQKNKALRDSVLFISRSFLNYLLQSDTLHGSVTGTTLVNQQAVSWPTVAGADGAPFSTLIDLETQNLCAALLPQNIPTKTPKGLYIKNTANNNRYFITKHSEFTNADIVENYFRAPLYIEQRTAELELAQQTLWELYHAITHGQISTSSNRPALPYELTTQYSKDHKAQAEKEINDSIAASKHYHWVSNEGIHCAWEANTDYFLTEDSKVRELAKQDPEQAQKLKELALKSGIRFLYDAKINLVWFEFNPETFFSTQGRFKEKKEEFIAQVTLIGQELKKIYHHKKMPKIFIGTDITTNFGVINPKNSVKDLYGFNYSKIPSPLDLKHFWKPELLDVFDTYCKTLGSVLPIDGIFLDFEMYHAQDQAGAYSELMDFSDVAWKLYCHSNNNANALKLKTTAQRIEFLKKNKLFDRYFTTLEAAAVELGRRIKAHVRALVPQILIAAYAPTLPSSWFYRGIMAGLSSSHEPLILTTFNTDYYSHHEWLKNHHIHLLHGAPILLSKFTDDQSFNLIDQLMQYHYFVWYNRPSRMVYANKKNQWWSGEASLLDAKNVSQGIRKKIKKPQKRSRL